MSGIADTFRRVRKGQVVQPFSAETHNAVVEAAQRVERSGLLPADGVRSAAPDDENAIYVLVKNTTGSSQPQFAVLGVGAPLILPTQNLLGFKERRAVTGIAPAAGLPFVVLQQPVANNAIGLGVVLGVTPCVLNVAGTADTYAFPTTDPTQLTSGGDGPARILWKDSGTGPGINALVLITQDDNDAPCCCGPTGGGGSGPPVVMPPTTGGTTPPPTPVPPGMIQTMTTGGGGAGAGPGGCGPNQVYFAGVGCVSGCPPGTFYDAAAQTCQPLPNYAGPGGTGGPGFAPAGRAEPTHALGVPQGNLVGFQGGRFVFPNQGGTGVATFAAGDLLYAATANPDVLTALAVGAAPDGYALVLSGGLPTWAAVGGGTSWVKVTKTFTDFSAASSSSTLTLRAFSAKEVLHAVVIKTSTVFSGGAITSYTLDVGDLAGTMPGHVTSYNGRTAVSTANFARGVDTGTSQTYWTEPVFAAFNLSIRATCNLGTNLNVATAGAVDVWLLVTTLP